MKRLFLALAALTIVASCGEIRNPAVAPPAEVARYAYKNTGPTSLRLYTVINRRSGAGGHTALGVNASERVIFDPAGSYKAEGVPRYGDVLYSASPAVEKSFQSAHARSTHYMSVVEIPVSPEVAEQALQLVKANGPVGEAFCAQSTSGILKQLPGFQSVKQTFYPVTLENEIKAMSIPGAKVTTLYEDD